MSKLKKISRQNGRFFTVEKPRFSRRKMGFSKILSSGFYKLSFLFGDFSGKSPINQLIYKKFRSNLILILNISFFYQIDMNR